MRQYSPTYQSSTLILELILYYPELSYLINCFDVISDLIISLQYLFEFSLPLPCPSLSNSCTSSMWHSVLHFIWSNHRYQSHRPHFVYHYDWPTLRPIQHSLYENHFIKHSAFYLKSIFDQNFFMYVF